MRHEQTYRVLNKRQDDGKCPELSQWGFTTLPPSMSRLYRQCGILNISQPYRSPRPLTGIAFFLTLCLKNCDFFPSLSSLFHLLTDILLEVWVILSRRSYYTRRKFRLIYCKVMKKSPHVHRNSSSFIRYCGNTNVTLSLLAETLPTSKETAVFDYPFNELLVSACFKFAVRKYYVALPLNRIY
jgi:hypothetical protein